MSESVYSDAQWHWIADRVGEGYLMKDISAFLGMHPNNIRGNLCRIGRRLDYVTLDDLNDMKEEFARLADVEPRKATWVRVVGVDDDGNEVRFEKMADAGRWLGVSTSEVYNAIKYKYKCHGYAWRKESTMSIREIDPSVKSLVFQNDGYCPCAVQRTPDTKCMCKEFREQETPGPCHCGRFEKVVE